MLSERPKASDTPDVAVLRVLAERPDESHTHGKGYSMPSIAPAFAATTPWKVQIAKMRALISRGLVEGCACGCRGDFKISRAGLRMLEAFGTEVPSC